MHHFQFKCIAYICALHATRERICCLYTFHAFPSQITNSLWCILKMHEILTPTINGKTPTVQHWQTNWTKESKLLYHTNTDTCIRVYKVEYILEFRVMPWLIQLTFCLNLPLPIKVCVCGSCVLHETSSAYWRAHIARQQMCTKMENSTKLFAEITFDEKRKQTKKPHRKS